MLFFIITAIAVTIAITIAAITVITITRFELDIVYYN